MGHPVIKGARKIMVIGVFIASISPSREALSGEFDILGVLKGLKKLQGLQRPCVETLSWVDAMASAPQAPPRWMPVDPSQLANSKVFAFAAVSRFDDKGLPLNA
jgi:hypothetical protein